jgi:hypothetical protein
MSRAYSHAVLYLLCTVRAPSTVQARNDADSSTCGWVPSGESDSSKSEQVKECMDLEHCLHWLHLEPTHLVTVTVTAAG